MFQTTNQYKMHVYISRVVQLCLSIFCLCAVTYYMTDSTLLAIATCWATRLCSGRDSCWLDKTQRWRFWLDGVHLLQDPNRVGVPYFLKWGEASSKKGEGGQGFLLRLHRSPQEEEEEGRGVLLEAGGCCRGRIIRISDLIGECCRKINEFGKKWTRTTCIPIAPIGFVWKKVTAKSAGSLPFSLCKNIEMYFITIFRQTQWKPWWSRKGAKPVFSRYSTYVHVHSFSVYSIYPDSHLPKLSLPCLAPPCRNWPGGHLTAPSCLVKEWRVGTHQGQPILLLRRLRTNDQRLGLLGLLTGFWSFLLSTNAAALDDSREERHENIFDKSSDLKFLSLECHMHNASAKFPKVTAFGTNQYHPISHY